MRVNGKLFTNTIPHLRKNRIGIAEFPFLLGGLIVYDTQIQKNTEVGNSLSDISANNRQNNRHSIIE